MFNDSQHANVHTDFIIVEFIICAIFRAEHLNKDGMAVVADAERQEVATVAKNALVVAEDLADKVDALTLRDNIADAFDNRIISSRSRVLLFAL